MDKPHGTRGEKINIVHYIGIAADEPKRIERHKGKKDIRMPLVEAGWTEPMCYEWCEQNGLLAPTYKTSMRDGCWFCHNQGIDQLRNLYHNYPELWEKLLKLDKDSPVTFHADGHTVHDFDRRFRWEDEGYKPSGGCFRWGGHKRSTNEHLPVFGRNEKGGHMNIEIDIPDSWEATEWR